MTHESDEVLEKKFERRNFLDRNVNNLTKTQRAAESYANLMHNAPLDLEQFKQLNASTKESLILLIGQISLLYIYQMNGDSKSSDFGAQIAKTIKELLAVLYEIMGTVSSPAMTSLTEAVEIWSATGSKNHILELLNLQVIKSLLLQQCASIIASDDYQFLKTETSEHDPHALKCVFENSNFTNLSPAAMDNEDQTVDCATTANEFQQDTTPESLESDLSSSCIIATTLLRNMLMLCILRSHFDARVLAIYELAAESMGCPALTLRIAIEKMIFSSDEVVMKHEHAESSRDRYFRMCKIAAVAAGLGALTAFSAGIAAPAIATGVSALGFAGTASSVSFLSTVGGSATLASIFGASSASLSGWKYSIRIGKITVFKFGRLEQQIVAFMSQHEGFRRPEEIELVSSTGAIETSAEGESDPMLSETPNSLQSIDSALKSQNLEQAVSLEFKLQQLTKLISGRRSANAPLTLTVCVSGWLRSYDDIWFPWRTLLHFHSDVYTLEWDPKILLNLGRLLVKMLTERLAVSAAQLWLQTTAAGALSTALMWPVALMHYASTLDNAWLVCKERATQAGKILADALCNRRHTNIQPVTLIGYSMGASIIFQCLLTLRKRRQYNLIHNAILLGAPEPCDRRRWLKAKEVISGRLINVYCSSDWLLGLLYRYMEWGVSVAGLSAVKVGGVENYDLKGFLKNHSQYADSINEILAIIKFFYFQESS